MTLKAVFRWRNTDSTADLNSRFKSLFEIGVVSGGTLSPVSGQLRVDVLPFEAFSVDGMLIVNDVSERLVIPINQTSIVSIKAQHQIGTDPTLVYAVTEASVFAALIDKAHHIVFGQVTLTNLAVQVLAADIAYYTRTEQTKRGRDTFRGRLASTASLPTNNRNRPGDYYIINAGVGDIPELYAWNGLAWVNITQTISLASDLAQHRANLFTNEIHLTNNQANAALGSFGTPSLANPFVTSTDTRVPTQNENDALIGSDGSPSSSNRYITELFPVAAPVALNFPFPPGSSVNMPLADGPYFVGSGIVGSASKYFFLMDITAAQGYVNTVNAVCSIVAIYKDALLTLPLNPGADADIDGYYTGDLYLSANNLIDTAVRVIYGKRKTLGTISNDFTVVVTPGDAVVPAEVVEKIANIKGRPFATLTPIPEQNINLRRDLDGLSSYVGSVLETNVVAAGEDFDRLSGDPILGQYFIKNQGVPVTYTFQNTGLVGISYNATLGRVTYASVANLSGVRVGDRFVDGVGTEYLVIAFSDLSDTVDIVSVETGLVPPSISTSVGTSVDASIKINNNPRDLLLSEMKFNFQSEIILTEAIEQTGNYSKPGGNIEWGVRRKDGRFDPRIAIYGGFEAASSGGGKFLTNESSGGEIVVTGFFNGLSLLMRRASDSPSFSVSIDGQIPVTVTSSDSGNVSSAIGSTLEPKYYRVPVAIGLSSALPSTISIRKNSSVGSFDLFGFEMFRTVSSTALLESGVAFESARLVVRSAVDSVVVPILDVGERGGRIRYSVDNDNYNTAIFAAADLDKGSTPAGTVTGTIVTISSGTSKLVNYRVNDIIMLTDGLVAEFRMIMAITSPILTLDSASSISGNCFLRHVCSTISTVANIGEETEIVRYDLPDDFIDGTPRDLGSTDTENRFVLSRDGHTLVTGTNLLNFSSAALIGSKSALRAATGSILRFRVMSTRLDLVSVNSVNCTANVSIDGSPDYLYTFSAASGQRKTIFFNGRYQDHEVTITVVSGNLDVSQMILFGPKKPSFSGRPDVVADLIQPARYLPSLDVFIAAPNTYPFGTAFYEDIRNVTKVNGSGSGSAWVASFDWAKNVFGPYNVTSQANAYSEFYFLGDSFELQYIMGPDHGMFKIEVDGVALESAGGVIVGTYAGLVVDGYNAVYTRRNIGLHSLTFGYHKVVAYIENARQRHSSSTDHNMGFVGYYVGNGSGYMAFGYSKEGIYAGTVDTRDFIPLPVVKTLESSTLTSRQNQSTLINGTTSVVVSFTAFPDNNYSVVANILNSTDGSPLFQAVLITAQTASSFTASWGSPLDSNGYFLNWVVLKIA